MHSTYDINIHDTIITKMAETRCIGATRGGINHICVLTRNLKRCWEKEGYVWRKSL